MFLLIIFSSSLSVYFLFLYQLLVKKDYQCMIYVIEQNFNLHVLLYIWLNKYCDVFAYIMRHRFSYFQNISDI